MQLKQYQKDTLSAIREYFTALSVQSPEDAYNSVTDTTERKARLGALRCYVKTPLDMPTVAIKVPTGGGKTIIAAHAIKNIAECQGREWPLVLWFTPTDTIRRQTAEALKKPRHPYRQALNEAFNGNVRVYDLDEIFMITPSDMDGNVCIVVATEQAFVKKEKSKYNVYKHNEAFEPHFASIRLQEGMDAQDEMPSLPKYSFANLSYYKQPIVIVDEAHKMTSELSKETMTRLNPSAVLGLTATPESGNNTLYSVHARELFDEEMIKLPIELTEFRGQWEQAVFAAIAKRQELEVTANEELINNTGGYLRPLVLFQATKVNGEVPVEALRSFLVNDAKIPEGEIAVVTGEQKELDGIDVTAPDGRIRYIITVEALKEGWDCPSAYVLCSVANIASNTATIQLLGRVMRQPNARRRKSPALNRAYAFVLSDSFGRATSEFAEGLRQKGFDETEAMAAIRPVQLPLFNPDELPLFSQTDATIVPAEQSASVAAELPAEVQTSSNIDGSLRISITDTLSDESVEKTGELLRKNGLETLADDFCRKVAAKRTEDIPARTLPPIRFPRICANVQGELCFDGEDALEVSEEHLESELPSALPEGEFEIKEAGDSFRLELEGNTIKQRFINEQLTFLHQLHSEMASSDIVNALSEITRCKNLAPTVMRRWITGIVNQLVTVRHFTPVQLYCFRHRLRDCLLKHLDETAQKVRRNAYQLAFIENDKVELDVERGFKLDERLYANRPLMQFYRGHYHFAKHFLGTHRIPAFDGRLKYGEGEEFECAKIIDSHPRVKTWLRNQDRDNASFSLPLAHVRFYPDFIGQLDDGRLFAVEYKGEQLRNTNDTLEKDAIGCLWARKSHGHCLFAMVFKDKNGMDVRQQLNRLFE